MIDDEHLATNTSPKDQGGYHYHLWIEKKGNQVNRIQIILEFKKKMVKVEGTVGLLVRDSELQKMFNEGTEQVFRTSKSFSVT